MLVSQGLVPEQLWRSMMRSVGFPALVHVCVDAKLRLSLFSIPPNSLYSHFRNCAPPLDVKGGIITIKVFPVFSESFFWTCFGLVMYIWVLMDVTEKLAFQMWKNNIDLPGFMGELLRGGIFTIIFVFVNMPPPFYRKYAPSLKQLLSIRSTGTSGWLSEFWLRLIKADDDYDDFSIQRIQSAE